MTNEIKTHVRDYCERLILAAKKEHKTTDIEPFPVFDPTVDWYIYNSLAYVLNALPDKAHQHICTVLSNISIMKKQRQDDAFKTYMELCEYTEKADLEAEAKYFEDRPDLKKDISCKKGCAWCCHQSVQLNGLEAKVLWARVPKVERFEKQVKSISSGGSFKQKTYVNKLGLQDSRCPFLTDKNECSTYETRPLVCRYYNVTEDPAKCFPLTVTNTLNMRLPIYQSLLEAAMFEAYGATALQTPGEIYFTKGLL